MFELMKILHILMTTFLVNTFAYNYVPMAAKEQYLSDILLRELVDRLGKELSDSGDSYMDSFNEMPSRMGHMSRATKDMEGEQLDYDVLLDGNPSPSLRDQEYLQHSSLWGHKYVSGGAGEGPHGIKAHVKTDASLPAYCNPPNPCPQGYTEEQGCITDFENSAAFSREYQASQECMCDGEHMFDCPNQDQSDDSHQINSDLESFLSRPFHAGEHKNLVAKKFQPHKEIKNPFLMGEKLPIAAKKGNNVE